VNTSNAGTILNFTFSASFALGVRRRSGFCSGYGSWTNPKQRKSEGKQGVVGPVIFDARRQVKRNQVESVGTVVIMPKLAMFTVVPVSVGNCG